jgi:hypothetical protein
MPEVDTISQVLDRLFRKGYTNDFKASDGALRVMPDNILVDPDQLIVDEIYRFEGETNLDDEAVIFALSCPHNKCKGTYLVAFGPMMDPLDNAMVQRLHRKKAS